MCLERKKKNKLDCKNFWENHNKNISITGIIKQPIRCIFLIPKMLERIPIDVPIKRMSNEYHPETIIESSTIKEIITNEILP